MSYYCNFATSGGVVSAPRFQLFLFDQVFTRYSQSDIFLRVVFYCDVFTHRHSVAALIDMFTTEQLKDIVWTFAYNKKYTYEIYTIYKQNY